MSANTVSLITFNTTYYFWDGSGISTAYNGSNSPYTSASTSCFQLAYNDTAGPIWVPTPAHAQMIPGGGPPFAIGRQPVTESYDNTTETLGIQIKATTKDNAITMLRTLRRDLKTSLYTSPVILTVKAGTNTGYTEVYSADIDEHSLYIVEPAGTWRATLTWTRAPFFGRLDSGETLVNAVTVNNTGTGSPDNIESLGNGAGDLIYDMQPLNISLTPGSGAFGQVFLAVISTRTYTTSGAGTYATSSTTGVTAYTLTHTLTNCLTLHNLKPRVIVRSSTAGSNVQMRLTVSFGGNVVYTGAWVTVRTNATLTDLGTYPVDIIRQRAKSITAPTASVTIQTRSTDGASASVTTTYTELLLYSTFMKTVIPSVLSVLNLAPFQVNSFTEQTGAVCLPYQAPSVFTRDSSIIDCIYDWRGTLPLYAANSNIYVAWLDAAAFAHTTSASATLTVTHAPLYATVRGNT